jgi:hypothetical protein
VIADHTPVLNIFQMEPDDGSIQAGGPFYRCMVEGCTDRVMVIDDRPVHVSPSGAPMFEVVAHSPSNH